MCLAAGCNRQPADYDARLQGTWFSDKEMTLRGIDEKELSKEKLQFLKENLGDLGFIYKKNEIAVLFKSDPDFGLEFNEYKLIGATENTVTISSLGGPEATLTFEGSCYFIVTDHKEYFCKKNEGV